MQLLPIGECFSHKPENEEIKYAIFCLPGRAESCRKLIRDYAMYSGLRNTLIIGITPANFCWYPMPKSPEDQTEAVAGLHRARHTIEQYISQVEVKYNLKRDKIALLGFSAGGVMAIQTGAYSKTPFAAVVSHAGAILEPKHLPYAAHPNMPFLLLHNKDDYCFDWFERYIPMKKALIQKAYYAMSIEEAYGGHQICVEEIEAVSCYLAHECFNQGNNWNLNEKRVMKFEICSK